MAVFEHETEFACSVEGLFDFLCRPANISRLSDPNVGIRFLSAPEVVYAGSSLEFEIVSFGQKIQATHQIVQFERPRLVIEQQVSGPMKAWKHVHEYVETENGSLKRDRVEFQLPGGLLGFLLNDQKIIDHLEDGFFYRQQQVNKLIEQGEIP
jgi:ligand-binding SRPBCC domain-containing protein